MNDELADCLAILAKILNVAGRSEETTAAHFVAKVPTGTLRQARDVLEKYRDTEYGTDAIRHATNRVWH